MDAGSKCWVAMKYDWVVVLGRLLSMLQFLITPISLSPGSFPGPRSLLLLRYNSIFSTRHEPIPTQCSDALED